RPLAAAWTRVARVSRGAAPADPGLGGPVSAGLRRLPGAAPARSRPLATAAGRREADGLRLPQRHAAQRLDAAARSVFRGRVYQLLLLWTVPGRLPDQ